MNGCPRDWPFLDFREVEAEQEDGPLDVGDDDDESED